MSSHSIACIFFIGIILFNIFFDSLVQAKEPLEDQLLKVVVISRHGARTPIHNNEYLGQWTEKQLPCWKIKHGNLTPHGNMFVSILWEQMYDKLGLKAFFPKGTCPDSDLIYIYANTIERTQATAVAILNGLVPGCNIPYYIMTHKDLDPLFLPVVARVLTINLKEASEEIKKYYGGLDAVQAKLNEPIQDIVSLLGPCPEETCKRYNLSAGCTILDLPNELTLKASSGSLTLSGCLLSASLFAENFFLEKIQWPRGDLSEIKVSCDKIKKVLSVHTNVLSLTHAIPLVAKINGSGLLSNIATALTDTNTNEGINKAKLVVFVGHDTNLVAISSLLSLGWEVGDYPSNEAALGGFLVFSLWRTQKGDVVRVHYVCQSLDTMIKNNIHEQEIIYEPLGLPLFTQPYSKPKKQKVFECSKEQFVTWVQTVIDKKCVLKPMPLKAKYILEEL